MIASCRIGPRISEQFRLEVTSIGYLGKLLAQSKACWGHVCSGLHPVKIWLSPRWEILQTLWSSIPVLHHPSSEKKILITSENFPHYSWRLLSCHSLPLRRTWIQLYAHGIFSSCYQVSWYSSFSLPPKHSVKMIRFLLSTVLIHDLQSSFIPLWSHSIA